MRKNAQVEEDDNCFHNGTIVFKIRIFEVATGISRTRKVGNDDFLVMSCRRRLHLCKLQTCLSKANTTTLCFSQATKFVYTWRIPLRNCDRPYVIDHKSICAKLNDATKFVNPTERVIDFHACTVN